MSKTFFDIGLSLDGFFAGANRSPQNPMGDQAPAIHNWMFIQEAFWDTHGMDHPLPSTPGHPDGSSGLKDDEDGNLIRRVFARAGAYIMGKRMFEEGEPNWPEDLYKAPVYVLTHEKRAPWVQKGSTTFFFINDGIESAHAKAKASAGNKDIRVMGGAETLWEYLNAGYIDEFTIHLAPILIGSGIRFFDGVDRTKLSLKMTSATASPLATHIDWSCR